MNLLASGNTGTVTFPLSRFGALLALSIIVLGVAIQATGQQIYDNSYLITVAEKVLDGATPYVDVAEVNLPATWLLYMPAVILHKWSGLRAEAFVVVEILALTFASGLATMRVLREAHLDHDIDLNVVNAVALFASLIVWGANFGQREHFAVLCLLPMLAVCAARAAGARLSARTAILAGVLAAVVVCLKPFYALPLGLPILASILIRRSPRTAFAPENCAAALTTLVYYVAVAKLTPAYFTIEMPQLVSVYIVGRYPLAVILTHPMALYLIAALSVLAYLCWRGRDTRAIMLTASAAGFFLTYVVQGKMSFNHGLPAIHLALVAFGVEYARRRMANPENAGAFLRLVLTPAAAIAPIFGMIHVDILQIDTYPGLYQAVERVAPAHPSIGAIAQTGMVAFPTVRRVNGRWVGRACSIWAAEIGFYMLGLASTTPDQKQRIKDVIHTQRAWLAEDLAQGKPDVILVEDAELRARELATSELAHALDGYRHAADASGVEIWLRADAAAPEPAKNPQI